jgi:hypothetical protein
VAPASSCRLLKPGNIDVEISSGPRLGFLSRVCILLVGFLFLNSPALVHCCCPAPQSESCIEKDIKFALTETKQIWLISPGWTLKGQGPCHRKPPRHKNTRPLKHPACLRSKMTLSASSRWTRIAQTMIRHLDLR